jgi:hypothetical protein
MFFVIIFTYLRFVTEEILIRVSRRAPDKEALPLTYLR